MQTKKRKRDNGLWLKAVLAVLIVLPYLGLYFVKHWYDRKVDDIANARFIVVEKESLKLHLYDYKGKELKQYGISCGKGYGNKQKRGDMRTPEGIFHVSEIENATTWGHDFKDGKGRIEGAYGPWFIRLEVPGHKGIGIHGTHKPESIGTRDTEGCVRLQNADIDDLRKRVHVGMVVVVVPSLADLGVEQRDSIKNMVNKQNNSYNSCNSLSLFIS